MFFSKIGVSTLFLIMSNLVLAGQKNLATFPEVKGQIEIPEGFSPKDFKVGLKIEVSCTVFRATEDCFTYEKYHSVKKNGEFKIESVEVKPNAASDSYWGPRVEYKLVAKYKNSYAPMDDRAYDFTWFGRPGSKGAEEFFGDYEKNVSEHPFKVAVIPAQTISLVGSENIEFITENSKNLAFYSLHYIDGQFFKNYISFKGLKVENQSYTIPSYVRIYSTRSPEDASFDETFPASVAVVYDAEYGEDGYKRVHFAAEFLEDGTQRLMPIEN